MLQEDATSQGPSRLSARAGLSALLAEQYTTNFIEQSEIHRKVKKSTTAGGSESTHISAGWERAAAGLAALLAEESPQARKQQLAPRRPGLLGLENAVDLRALCI